MHCQLSRLPVAYTVALVDKAGAVLFVVASWALPCTLNITVLYPNNSVRYGTCIRGVGGLCVVGGARHGRVWVTDAARLYQTSPDTISAPRAHEVPASGQYVQDLWGKFSPNPLPHFLTEEGALASP